MLSGAAGTDDRFGNLDNDAPHGDDRIDDFEPGLDHIVLTGGATVAGLAESDVNGGGRLDTAVTLSSGDTILLLLVSGVADPLQLA